MSGPATPTRERILDAALDLTARKGAEGTSMRELADACEVNVAALYYHFPSKADLLRAVIAERQYELRMELVPGSFDTTAPAQDRVFALLESVWEGIGEEEQILRLLLAESCHHNADAIEVSERLTQLFEELIIDRLTAIDGLAVSPEVGAGLVADFLLASITRMMLGADTSREILPRATNLAAVLTGQSGS